MKVTVVTVTHSIMGIISTITPWLLVVCLVSPSSTCPAPCQCKWKDGLNTLDCVEKNITKLPSSSHTIEAIVLDRNDLSILVAYDFYNAKWSHVRRVSMRFCKLDSVKEDLFFGLTNLHFLDLSHNYFTSLDKFPPLPVLRTLDLSHNLLNSIHKDSLSSLGPSLERIDLSQNLLTSLPPTTFSLLPKLRQLSLGDNPWHCNCMLGHLHSELALKNIHHVQGICATPERLASKSWSSFHSSEFTCPPSVSLPHPHLQSVQAGEAVLLRCNISGNPIPTVTWKKDGHTLPQVSDLFSITQNAGGDVSTAFFSVLTIRNMSRPSLGVYSCVAKNKDGVEEKELQITYLEAEEIIIKSDKQSVVLIVTISASTAVFVSIMLMVITLFCQRKMKKRKNTSTHSSCFTSHEYNDNKPSFTSTNPVPKPPRVGDYDKMSCEDIYGTLSRCSTQQTYLPADACDRDTSHLSGDDTWNENVTPHGQPGMNFLGSLDQIPLMSNLAGSRASLGTLSSISAIDPIYGTTRRPYHPQHSTAHNQAVPSPPNCHPRPGYVTLPRRPKQRPALPLGDSLGPRSSADGCSRSNISILPLDHSLNHQCKSSTTLLPYTPPTPAAINAINTVGLPAVDISTSGNDFPMRTSTSKTVPEYSPPPSRAHLDTIQEQE